MTRTGPCNWLVPRPRQDEELRCQDWLGPAGQECNCANQSTSGFLNAGHTNIKNRQDSEEQDAQL
jgi:hypothetical protein